MNRPSWQVRVNGSPRVAAVMCVVYVVIIAGWWTGDFPWWLALVAVVGAKATLSAVKQMRRYKAWLAQWEAMAEDEDAPPRRCESRANSTIGHRNVWKQLTWAAMLLGLMPFFAGLFGVRLPEGVALPWGLACLFLICRLVAWLFGLVSRRGTRRVEPAKGEERHVSLLLGRVNSSPSRADAERQLPEYCARLIADNGIVSYDAIQEDDSGRRGLRR